MIRPRLVVITDTSRAPLGLLERRIERCCVLARPGSVVVQLRDLGLPTRERLRLGERLIQIAHGAAQFFVVNDRIDLALLLEADGVHLGEAGVSASAARALLASRGGTPWISSAWHDPAAPPRPDADAYLLSPIVAARKGRPAFGLSVLATARKQLSPGTQLFALGGIETSTAAACIVAGADGVAAIGAVLATNEPLPLLRALGIAAS